MKNRTELAKYFATLNFKVGAEIGVAQGYFSEVICQQNPGVKLYCIDYWQPYRGYMDFRKKKTFKGLFDEAQERLNQYNCILIKKFSMDAVKDFEDNSLDFVFIDSHHGYTYVQDDIREWTKKVKIDGIVSGHDYYITNAGNVGVVNAVDEYTKKYNYNLLLTDWDRKNPKVDERQPSWYFIKTH